MADILKELIKNNFDGIGSALKPSIEPICFSRKPLEKGLSIAENCLKYGTGGINIDESRVEAQGQDLDKLNSEWDREWNTNYTDYAEKVGGNAGFNMDKAKKENAGLTGRFPANLIHDGSEEVLKEFEKAGISKSNNGRINKIGTPTDSPVSFGVANKEHEYSDEGTPARFFKQCEFTEEDFEYAPFFYCTKASKSERNMGCEELEEKRGGCMEANVTDKMQLGGASLKGEPKEIKPTKNNHPTVKPLKLMEYLIKMVTPKGGIVLDPFAGSGTTLVASKKLGYKYIGIELTPEYIPIIEARLNSIQQGVLF